MTDTSVSTTTAEAAGVANASAPSEAVARAAEGREEIERELAADPWHLVRRACQVADYEFGAAASPETDPG